MAHSAPSIDLFTGIPTETVDLSTVSRRIVAATFDDEEFRDALALYGPVSVVTELKRVLADIGDQEQHRIHGLSDARDDDDLTDEEFHLYKKNFNLWKRSIAEVRQRLRRRIAEIQPIAQLYIDEHQADRRTLVVLAKRIWLWEEGREDRLEDALDNFTISGTVGDPTRPRRTLREVIEEIAANGGVTP